VLAAARLSSAWEDINHTRRRSYAGNQSYKIDLKNEFDNSIPFHLKKNKTFALADNRGKEKVKARASNIPSTPTTTAATQPGR